MPKEQAKPEVDPNAHYEVKVTTPFPFEGVGLGTISRNELAGDMLARLLASDEASKVASYSRVAD